MYTILCMHMLFSLRLFSADYIEYLDYLLSLTIYIYRISLLFS